MLFVTQMSFEAIKNTPWYNLNLSMRQEMSQENLGRLHAI